MSEPIQRTREEIEHLKSEWLKDPCWDLFKSEGFEYHADELYTFQERQQAKWDAEHAKRIHERHEMMMEHTGIADIDITQALHTFNEIEHEVELNMRHLTDTENSMIVVMQASQIRATLLQCAQLKRIADALEIFAYGAPQSTTAKVNGA